MDLFSGHPADLKKSFLNFIGQVKQNPLDKALIVLPSQRLAAELKITLAEAKGCVSALYFADFTRLATEIASAEEDYKPLQKVSPLQNFIIKNILEDFGAEASRGYCFALKAAFLDLSGAQASAQDLITIAQETETFSAEQKEELKKLALFYSKYSERTQNDFSNTYAQMFEAACASAPKSKYLKDFKNIIFYGSYDFTGLQSELFKAICANYNVTVFCPYEDNPAYKFSKKTFEADMLGRAKNHYKIEAAQTALRILSQNVFKADAGQVEGADVKIISVSGAAAELEAAAKQILFWKEERQIDFKDIALTARTLEPYRGDIINIMEQNKIPLNVNLEMPLLQDTFAAFIFNLFNLAKNNFYRDDVRAVITSPYFRDKDELWPFVIKKTGVSAGLRQWLDLLPLASDKDSPNPAAQNAAEKLADFLVYINNVLAKLSAEGTFEDLSSDALGVIDACTDKTQIKADQTQTLQTVQTLLKQISAFGQVRSKAHKGEFLEEFTTLLKEQTFNRVSSAQDGIIAADVMALRGQSFKAAVIIGLNEGLMPVQPQHDPVLKEDYRNLMQKLGYSLHTRADRYDEEKLLFYFALSAAEQSLTLVYQRSGEDGKPKIPSLYLTQTMRLLGQDLNGNKINVLSRRPAERYSQIPPAYLTLSEAQILTCLGSAQNKTEILEAITDPPQNKKDFVSGSFEAANALAARAALTPYDGFIGPKNALAAETEEKGISPSNLQILYKCPARFLFEKVTGREDDIPFERAALPPTKKGTLYHKILEDFYRNIKEHKLFDKLFAGGAAEMMKAFAADYLSQDKYKEYGMYPVMWDITAREMTAYLCELVKNDVAAIQASRLYPQMFEYAYQTETNLKNGKLKLKGKLDRINVSADGKNFSITDYKTKKETAGIERAIFKKAVLQPPLYFEMAKNLPDLAGSSPVTMTLMGIETQGNGAKELTYDEYSKLRPRIADMLEFITDLEKRGVFIINPEDDVCKNCRFETACRKAHAATYRRCRRTQESKTLRDYHATAS